MGPEKIEKKKRIICRSKSFTENIINNGLLMTSIQMFFQGYLHVKMFPTKLAFVVLYA